MNYSDAFRAMECGHLVTHKGWANAYLRLIAGKITLINNGVMKPYDEPDNERLSKDWYIRSRNKPRMNREQFVRILQRKRGNKQC